MTKIETLSRDTSLEDLENMIKINKVVVLPFTLNKNVYIVKHHKPQKVMVTDISMKGIQLNGVFSTWEDLEANGGIYGSEYDALSAIATRGL